MDETVKKVGDFTIRIINSDNQIAELTPEDQEMDKRAKAAVKSAINKAKVCQKPIAKYDARKKKAYVILPNGDKEYVE